MRRVRKTYQAVQNTLLWQWRQQRTTPLRYTSARYVKGDQKLYNYVHTEGHDANDKSRAALTGLILRCRRPGR